MSRRANPAAIGAFVLGAVVLAVIAVGVLGSGRFFRRTHPFVAHFQGSVNGLDVGAPVKFKGVKVGSVEKILLNLSAEGPVGDDVRIPVIFEIDEEYVRERGGVADVGSREWIEGAIARGLRAQLSMESFVTGLLYVSLDLHPGTRVDLVGNADPRIPEVPTLPTTLQQVQSEAAKVIERLQRVDLEALVVSITEAARGVQGLVGSPELAGAVGSLERTLGSLEGTAASLRGLTEDIRSSVPALRESLAGASAEAGTALREATASLRGARELLDPEGPLTWRLDRTLEEVAAAARAVRHLAETLDRNPALLVRGRPEKEEVR